MEEFSGSEAAREARAATDGKGRWSACNTWTSHDASPDEDRGEDVRGYWFVLDSNGEEYLIVRIIYGYPKETKSGTKVTQGPGWVWFRPRGKRPPFPPDVAAEFEQRLIDSGFYEAKKVGGMIYQVRTTDLDRPEVRKHVFETCKWLVSVLRKR